MTDDELDKLSGLARDGDQAAVAKVLVHLLPVLSRISRREAKGFVDPEDLQSHAVEALLRAWSRGTGPSANVVGYLAQTMRNRVIDEMRSPRSRTRSFYETEDFASDHDPSSAVDLEKESRWVKRGLKRLRPDQQRLLVGIYYEGMKPAQLAEELEKSPNAIYSLTKRSKQALRKAMLQEALVEDGEASCRAAAGDLPDAIADDFEETPATTPGMRHIGECRTCRASWKRFGSLTSALGIAGIVVLSVEHGAAVPASAAESAWDEGRLSPTEGEARAALGPPDEPVSPDVERADPEILPSTEHAPQTSRWRTAVISLAAGVLFGAAAATMLPRAVASEVGPAPAGSLVLSVDHQDEVNVTVDVQIDDENEIAGQVRLTHPSSLVLQRIPEGANCAAETTAITCVVAPSGASHWSFGFGGTASLAEKLELELRATSGEYVFTGEMRSGVPNTGSSATTKAEVLAGQ